MFRTILFVPGINQRFIDKAKNLSADIICFDLEDSVPQGEKHIARKLIKEKLKEREHFRLTNNLYVRINSPDSGICSEDILLLVQRGLDGIIVPKVNDEIEIANICSHITNLEEKKEIEKGHIKLMPSIETAKGVVNAYSIAKADPRINALVFGVYDFLYDMRLDYIDTDGSGYMYARMKIPVDARAAGILAIDSVWQKIDDIVGLKSDAVTAKRLGYCGKTIIHPNHIDPVNEVFMPSKMQVEWATKVVKALEPVMYKGKGMGAIKLEGKMLDIVHYKHAKAILDIAGAGTTVCKENSALD